MKQLNDTNASPKNDLQNYHKAIIPFFKISKTLFILENNNSKDTSIYTKTKKIIHNQLSQWIEAIEPTVKQKHHLSQVNQQQKDLLNRSRTLGLFLFEAFFSRKSKQPTCCLNRGPGRENQCWTKLKRS